MTALLACLHSAALQSFCLRDKHGAACDNFQVRSNPTRAHWRHCVSASAGTAHNKGGPGQVAGSSAPPRAERNAAGRLEPGVPAARDNAARGLRAPAGLRAATAGLRAATAGLRASAPGLGARPRRATGSPRSRAGARHRPRDHTRLCPGALRPGLCLPGPLCRCQPSLAFSGFSLQFLPSVLPGGDAVARRKAELISCRGALPVPLCQDAMPLFLIHFLLVPCRGASDTTRHACCCCPHVHVPEPRCPSRALFALCQMTQGNLLLSHVLST